jgi:hypothetical protein
MEISFGMGGESSQDKPGDSTAENLVTKIRIASQTKADNRRMPI